MPRDREKLLELTSLIINSYDVSEFPESIGNLTNLTTLDLVGSGLSELPDWLDQDKISIQL